MVFEISDIVKIKLLVDDKSSIDLANHPMNHSRSKHIKRRYNFLRDQVGKEMLNIKYCKTKLELAYILTKPLKQTRFEGLKKINRNGSLEKLN